MSAKRVLFISSIITLLTLVSMTSGNAGTTASMERRATLSPAAYLLGKENQLSPEGNAERYHPEIAYNYNHREHLVVWHNTWPGGFRDIYARRVSRTGQVLSWFAVTTGAESRFQPAVAYNALNDEYLVVWMQEAAPEVYEIWGRIIPWNGPGANADFKIISWANRSFWTPRVAWNSLRNEYLVAWNAFDTTTSFPPGVPSDIAGLRVSASGVVQNPGAPLILTTYANPHQVDLVYNPSNDEYFLAFVVVHSQGTTSNDIYGLRVSWDGVPVNPPGLIQIFEGANIQNDPAVATNRWDRYMVVWEHEYGNSDHDIYGREYYADGSPVGSFFTIASWTEDTTSPDVAANGAKNEWMAVWQQDLGSGAGYAVKGYRWGSGPDVWTYFFDVANYAFWENENPAVSAAGSAFLIAYEGDDAMTDRHIYARLWWPETQYLPFVKR